MPKIEKRDYPPGEFSGRWRDYNVYTKLSPSAKKYITAVNKNTGKQLRRYEYVKALLEDEDIPNSIEELNKMAVPGTKEWHKLYMRARRRLDIKGGGNRKNPKRAFPDSIFQKEGVRKKGPGRGVSKGRLFTQFKTEREKDKIIKEIEQLKNKELEQYKKELEKRKELDLAKEIFGDDDDPATFIFDYDMRVNEGKLPDEVKQILENIDLDKPKLSKKIIDELKDSDEYKKLRDEGLNENSALILSNLSRKENKKKLANARSQYRLTARARRDGFNETKKEILSFNTSKYDLSDSFTKSQIDEIKQLQKDASKVEGVMENDDTDFQQKGGELTDFRFNIGTIYGKFNGNVSYLNQYGKKLEELEDIEEEEEEEEDDRPIGNFDDFELTDSDTDEEEKFDPFNLYKDDTDEELEAEKREAEEDKEEKEKLARKSLMETELKRQKSRLETTENEIDDLNKLLSDVKKELKLSEKRLKKYKKEGNEKKISKYTKIIKKETAQKENYETQLKKEFEKKSDYQKNITKINEDLKKI